MKIIKLENAEKFKNGKSCNVLEYPFNDQDINIATATINGRYPDKGYAINTKCKEVIYVIKGSGILYQKNNTIQFEKGDVIMILPNEEYYFEAKCTILMPCTPAWTKEQYKNIE